MKADCINCGQPIHYKNGLWFHDGNDRTLCQPTQAEPDGLIISREEFDKLPLNYIPPDVPSQLGQRWKQEIEGRWWVAEYVSLEDGAIHWRKAIVQELKEKG